MTRSKGVLCRSDRSYSTWSYVASRSHVLPLKHSKGPIWEGCFTVEIPGVTEADQILPSPHMGQAS